MFGVFVLLATLAVPATEAKAAAEVEVVRDGGSWTADYRFSSAAPAWVFADSVLPRESKTSFRAQSWTVLTPGVRIERRGWHDVLVADRGAVPERVQIRFTPYTEDIEAAYDAALAFTGGSVALYAGKFDVLPAPSAQAVERLPIDLSGSELAKSETAIRMRDTQGALLLHGRRVPAATIEDSNAYVLFGNAEPLESEAMRAIIDAELPQWLGSFIAREIPEVLQQYSARLGPAPGNKPLVMVSWLGPTAGMTSMGGSVLPSTIVMTFEGEGLRSEKESVRHEARWFAAHEGAHFWLGQAVGYEGPEDGWITEGGADLLAYRAVAATDPSFDATAALQTALDECLKFSAKGGVASANERADHKAYYHCGAIFGLAAERASGGDFAAFVRHLIESNQDDRTVSREEWLAALDARAPGKQLGRQIGYLLDHPAPDAGAWVRLLSSAGVPHRLDPGGLPKLQ